MERKRTLREVADTVENIPTEQQPVAAPLATPEASSSDSSADLEKTVTNEPDEVEQKDGVEEEKSEETEGLLSDVLESADKIYNRHLQGNNFVYWQSRECVHIKKAQATCSQLLAYQILDLLR